MLGLSRIAVFKRVKSGRLAALRVGRNWAIPASLLPATGGAGAGGPAAVQAPAAQEQTGRAESNDSALDSMGWD